MCAQPQDHDWVCGRCYESPPAYTATFAAWQYALPIDHLISRFKYQGELAVAPALASAFRDCAPSPPDGAVMVPVPSHRQRLRERGFDHIAMLAKDICRPLSIPLQMDVLRRVRHTPAQSGLTASQRQRNLAGAFAVSGAVPETIILFDDVITTGATVRAASKVLKRAGAKQLIVWALARA
jgi:ComF family protein